MHVIIWPVGHSSANESSRDHLTNMTILTD
jgi:hypothetical protein